MTHGINSSDIKTKLQTIFEDLGIMIVDGSELVDVDSLAFINLIIEIENIFSIAIETEMLEIDVLQTFDDYQKMVESYLLINLGSK